MPQEIYNEGRVVGLSAWEIFVKEALGNGVSPKDIPDEPKWLASMIGCGSSMILKIPEGTEAGVREFALPTESNLSAAGVVIANPFMGSCTWDGNTNWATKVISYSPLIQNEAGAAPSPTGNTVPYDPDYNHSIYRSMLGDYVKITDGVVYTKNAKWLRTPSGQPYEDIDPNFNSSTTYVRLLLSETLRSDVYVLFTGFTNRRILQGLSGFAAPDGDYSIGGSTDTDHNDWINGGMLGPEMIPWSSKIIFTVPSSAYNLANTLVRTLPSDEVYDATEFNIDGIHISNMKEGTAKSNPIIDFNSIVLNDYYKIHGDNNEFLKPPVLQEDVSEVSFVGANTTNAIVAWYPGMTAELVNDEAGASTPSNANFFPPALYAVQITAQGSQNLVPLDVTAPGTVKGFRDPTQAYNYKMLMPDNYALYQDPNNNIAFVTRNEQTPTNWAGLAKLDLTKSPKGSITAGLKSSRFISLTAPNGTQYGNQNGELDGSGGTLTIGPANSPSWDNLLSAIAENKYIDILGQRLHAAGVELQASPSTFGISADNQINNIGATNITLNPSVNAKSVSVSSDSISNIKHVTLENGSTIKVGKNFITFGNDLRLYISRTQPTDNDVPIGSIGIGWTEQQ